MQTHIFGVYDGHGLHGHHVSNYISSNLPLTFVRQYFGSESSEEITPAEALHRTYRELFQSLVSNEIDISFSGATATTCFLEGSKIYTANSGDSRAIIGSKSGKKN